MHSEYGQQSADINNINQSITLIQQELARQTHFRGYYLLNADIIKIASNAAGDFAFSAESGTVWIGELSIVNGTASAGISTSYSRGDHIHPQQLTYDGSLTATKFIKTGGTNQQILLAVGTNKIKSNIRIQNGYNRRFEATQLEQFSGSNVRVNLALQDNLNQYNITTNTLPTGALFTSTAIQNQFLNQGGIINGIAQINPNSANYSQSLRISRSTARCGIYLGIGLTIGLSNESGAANRGLRISADGNTLSFNGSVIAKTGASNGANNGSVNYSASNPILWGVNSTGTEGEFYSDGAKIYWRAQPLTMGSIPP
ncbi:MAG: hypothetical protein EZS28_013782 [Streblomastix strix]|uniref:Uncharacterized protein n=1 Tax=Streblomastix strix TaxID=222440 RepID=A0A5J4W744_9EUKA|nr:MAG: hypothetical protein EZS28_013782 [Streblomastix strix]